MKCFRRLFPNPNEHVIVDNEFADFSLKSELFGDPDAILNSYNRKLRKW